MFRQCFCRSPRLFISSLPAFKLTGSLFHPTAHHNHSTVAIPPSRASFHKLLISDFHLVLSSPVRSSPSFSLAFPSSLHGNSFCMVPNTFLSLNSTDKKQTQSTCPSAWGWTRGRRCVRATEHHAAGKRSGQLTLEVTPGWASHAQC